MSWVRIPPEQLFFLFGEKRVVWVSCLPLFSIYRKEFSCTRLREENFHNIIPKNMAMYVYEIRYVICNMAMYVYEIRYVICNMAMYVYEIRYVI